MSFLKKLFGGGGGSSAAPAEMHNGFAIYAEPLKDGGTYRIAARIEKEIDGELKVQGKVPSLDEIKSLLV